MPPSRGAQLGLGLLRLQEQTARPASPLTPPCVPGSSFTHVRTGGSAFSTSVSAPAAPEQAAAAVSRHAPAHAPARAPGASALAVASTPPPLLEIRVPLSRGRGASARRLPQPQPQGGLGLGPEDVPRLRVPNPQLAAQLGPIDYEYYDDEVDAAPSATKVKIHGDGWIECLDRGNFPHPFSCRKFISCAKMESGDLQGWEYTCPRGLSFDPIGGICNWSAGLGCKAR
ncbi:Protein AC150 [Frankliniella fusca]|uniref:Protein AC150 n=1 Tax=Frankliniella fusca TaxID=407009 RepID=A0AAE1LJL2_9NEOP|nr:Protein AC150 [Frankliniella fusca]